MCQRPFCHITSFPESLGERVFVHLNGRGRGAARNMRLLPVISVPGKLQGIPRPGKIPVSASSFKGPAWAWSKSWGRWEEGKAQVSMASEKGFQGDRPQLWS